MKVSLTSSDVKQAIQDFLAVNLPAIAGSDLELEFSLTRGPNAQLTVDLHVGADAQAFRDAEAAKPAPLPRGRKKAEDTTEEVTEEEVTEEQEEEEVPAAKAPARPKAFGAKRTA